MQVACQRGSGCIWRGRPRATQRGREVAAAAVRIRQCRPADTDQVARLCANVFAEATFAELDVPALTALDQRYAAAVQREVATKLQEALSAKQQAAVAARASRLQAQAALLRAQLAAARGDPATWPTQGPQQRRQEAAWTRARTWVCLLATATPTHTTSSTSSSSSTGSGSAPGSADQQQQQEEEEGDKEVLLGCLTLNLMQPDATLPPPWPSAAPWRPYLGNMAVAPAARRRGVAAALLAAAERLVRAWGGEGIWLHVAEDNTPAQALYTSRGYTRVTGASGWPFSLTPIPKRQLLLSKPLPPRGPRRNSSSSAGGMSAGGVGAVMAGGGQQVQQGAELAVSEAAGADSSSSSSSSRVYTWQVVVEPKAVE